MDAKALSSLGEIYENADIVIQISIRKQLIILSMEYVTY